MKTTVTENGIIQLEEVFVPIVLKTPDGETMTVCMRDGGFEINYQNKPYFANKGQLRDKTPNYTAHPLNDGDERVTSFIAG
jgi:hypothetical protein